VDSSLRRLPENFKRSIFHRKDQHQNPLPPYTTEALALHFFIPLLLIASQSATQVTLIQLDESRLEGSLAQWTDDSLRLEGEQFAPVTVGDLLRLEVEPAPRAERKLSPPVEVELVDGSCISASVFASKDSACSLSPLIEDLPDIRVPLAAVRSVRLMPASDEPVNSDIADELQTQWLELAHQDLAADAIVIRKRGVNSLDYVEGVLGDVGETHVQFTLDGQQLAVSREKVYGIVYYRGTKGVRKPANSPVVSGPAIRIIAEQVGWANGQFMVSNSLVGTLNLPSSSVASIDFSAGRLVYLSDLEPDGLRWSPTPGASQSAPLFGGLARDRGFYSPTIDIEYPASSLPPERSTSAGLPYVAHLTKGLALRTNLEVRYPLADGYQWFRATAAIAPGTHSAGRIEIQVLGDRQLLTSKNIAAGDAPIELECDIRGVSELSLVVSSSSKNGNKSTGMPIGSAGLLNLGGARITQ